MDWRKYVCLTMDLYQEYEKNLKFTNEKPTSRIKKWTEDLNRQVTNEDVQMVNSIQEDIQHH